MRVADRLKALPPSAQLMLAVTCVLTLTVVLVVAYFVTRPKYDLLFADLRPADAATIIAELDDRKISYRLSQDGAVIHVPSDVVAETRLNLMSSDLPLKGTVGFELFNKSDMGLTEFAQRINYQRALQGELARTIMTVEAIESARVHLTLPEPSIFRADRRPAEASVTLAMRPGRQLAQETVEAVQRLVAASVPDLETADVVVINAQGSLVSARPISVEHDAAVVPPTVQRARAIEDYYTAAVRQAVEPFRPDARVRVRIPPDQWATDTRSRDAILASWSPGVRDFMLSIEVTAASGISPEQQEEVRAALIGSTGIGSAAGDQITFPTWVEDAVPDLEPLPVESAEPSSPAEQPTSRSTPMLSMGGLLMTLVLAAALVGLAWVATRRRGTRPLSAQERENYVRRLRRLLDEQASETS